MLVGASSRPPSGSSSSNDGERRTSTPAVGQGKGKDQGAALRDRLRRDFNQWVSGAWADVVSHPDPIESMKHEAAGTRVERMRKRHFGYAMACASKPRQKVVPDGFLDGGHFWGY